MKEDDRCLTLGALKAQPTAVFEASIDGFYVGSRVGFKAEEPVGAAFVGP